MQAGGRRFPGRRFPIRRLVVLLLPTDPTDVIGGEARMHNNTLGHLIMRSFCLARRRLCEGVGIVPAGIMP